MLQKTAVFRKKYQIGDAFSIQSIMHLVFQPDGCDLNHLMVLDCFHEGSAYPHHVVVRIRYCPHHSLIAKGYYEIELLESQ